MTNTYNPNSMGMLKEFKFLVDINKNSHDMQKRGTFNSRTLSAGSNTQESMNKLITTINNLRMKGNQSFEQYILKKLFLKFRPILQEYFYTW